MTTIELRSNIDSLRAFIDQQAYWLRQATQTLYDMEEKLFDVQDFEYDLKYKTGSIQFLKDAANENNVRQDDGIARCADQHTGANGFYQSDFDLKKIV